MKVEQHKIKLKDFLSANKLAESEVVENRNGKIVVSIEYPVQRHSLLTDLKYIINEQALDRSKRKNRATSADYLEYTNKSRIMISNGYQGYRVVFT